MEELGQWVVNQGEVLMSIVTSAVEFSRVISVEDYEIDDETLVLYTPEEIYIHGKIEYFDQEEYDAAVICNNEKVLFSHL